MAIDEGFATSVTFQSGFCAYITNVDVDGMERAALETSNNASVNGWRTFQPSDLKDAGEVTVELRFQASDNWKTAMTAAAEAVVVTFPIPAGLTTGGKITGTGFMRAFKIGDPFDGIMSATATLKLTGEVTFSAPS